MRVAIGSDHAGFDLKEAVKGFLAEDRTEFVDVGVYSRDPVDYPDCAEAIGAALRDHRADRAILLCGSGVGASMAANRLPGVRAGLCHDTYSAHQGVEHDDMNVLVLGGRVVGVELAHELVHAFLDARFTGDVRHLRRLAKVTALENPLRALQVFGQSVWLDYIRRTLVTSGELQRMIEEDGLCGVTSNPAIFEKAITGSSDYRDLLEAPEARLLDAKALYERIALRDVRDAADALLPVYEETSKRDGFVSLEVSPLLADDTAGTIDEARRLWRAVDRPNLMIKVPATLAGIPAIEQIVGEGINVNVTLLFSQQMYERVAFAYIGGLERFATGGGDVRTVASVASFFISRIDSAIDGMLAARLRKTANQREQALLRSVMGKVAIANAKLTYERYREIFTEPRWSALAGAGARTQRLLWASTGTKNPAYRDVVYVEELVGFETVNTMPPATLDAFRDHGRPRASLDEDLDAARDTMATLADLGIPISQITDTLLKDGVQLFVEAFGKLLDAVKTQSRPDSVSRAKRLSWSLPEPLAASVGEALAGWGAAGNTRRLWARDATLWTGTDEARWLGWLGITNDQLANIGRLRHLSELARGSEFTHALLIGMGGSSLCPEVLQTTFGRIDGFPELHVLDSTDPAQVRRVESAVDLSRTICIVSSKSGSTLEPNILAEYFFERVKQLVGADEAGRRFIAITDPGSKLQQIAESERYRRVFFGWPDIGGRYSALSDFGLVPAAVMCIDVPKLLERAEEMVCACMPPIPVEENPGVALGVVLGVAASRFGRDKMTIVASPGIASFGAWLEQLVAESTGKGGKGIIPVDGESLVAPDRYDHDRIFVYLRLRSAPDAAHDKRIDALERAGHPVVRITLDDLYDLGGEFFRWEIATAAAGAVLGIHPFDQPDVEASKNATRKLTAEYEARGALPTETPLITDGGIRLFAGPSQSPGLTATAGADGSLGSYLKAHLGRLREGDYCALLAYIDRTADHDRILQAMRDEIRAATRAATCVQFGPRFLHSTGQAYKGGPNSGVFLQITSEDAADLPVPGRRFTFGIVKAAQARGDFQVLVDRDRRALRVHLGADVGAGLEALHAALRRALRGHAATVGRGARRT